MMRVFYFFLKSSVDDEPAKYPICAEDFLGDIGDFVEVDGVGYIITDYTEEVFGEEEDDRLYW